MSLDFDGAYKSTMYASAEKKKKVQPLISVHLIRTADKVCYSHFFLISSILLIVEYGQDGLWGLHIYLQEESPVFP